MMMTASYLTQLMAFSLALLLVFFVAPCTGQNGTLVATNSSAANVPKTATDNALTQPANGNQTQDPATSTNQDGGKFHFDCKRSGDTCLHNGTCNLESGKCSCTITPSDYMCNPTTPVTGCVSACQNGGSCVIGINGPTCACTESFYGTDCGLPRAQVLCDANKMYINVYPTGNFEGYVYVQDHPSCVFNFFTGTDAINKIAQYTDYTTKPASFGGFQGLGRDIPHDDATCGSVSAQNGVYLRIVYIQYSSVFKSSVDQVLYARCSSNAQNTTIYLDPITVKDYTSNVGQIDTEGKGGIVKLNLMKSDGSPATAVNLGDPVSLVFKMAGGGTGGNSDFLIQRCTANNTKTGLDFIQVIFIENGCPTEVGKSIVTGFPTHINNAGIITVTIILKAFVFLGSSNVAFSCSIQFCTTCPTQSCSSPPAPSNSGSGNSVNPSNSGSGNSLNPLNPDPGNSTNPSNTIPANSSNTPNPNTGNGSNEPPTGRKRRDAPTQNDLAATMTVIDPASSSGQQGSTPAPPATKEPQTTEDCINNPKITAVVAILAACVGLLLIVSAILAFLLVASKRKAAPSRHYSSPVETVRIPRLEMYNTNQAGM